VVPSLTASPYRYVVLFVSTYLIFSANGGLFLLIVALKPIAQDFGWPRSVPSSAYSLQFLGTGIGGILMGYWFDRRGVAPVVLLGSVMMGLGATLTSFVTAEWQLYVIYGVMMGLLGQATMFGPLMVNAMRWFEDRRGFAVGVVAAGQSLAGAFWPPIFRYCNETAGWRQTFLWFGLFALITSVPLTFVLRRPHPHVTPRTMDEPEPSGPTADEEASTAIGLSPRALQAIICFAIVGCCVAMSMPLAHIVAHTSDLGHATSRAAEMLSVLLAATLIVRLLAGSFILDRFGGLLSLLIFSALQALALTFYAAVDGLLALYAVSLMFGLGYGGIGMCYPIIVREYLPASQAGRRLGLVNLFGAGGMALGGWLAGVVFDLQGTYSPAFMVGVAFNVANIAIILVLLARRGRSRLQPFAARA
jgi:MFS family permease